MKQRKGRFHGQVREGLNAVVTFTGEDRGVGEESRQDIVSGAPEDRLTPCGRRDRIDSQVPKVGVKPEHGGESVRGRMNPLAESSGSRDVSARPV